VDEQGRVGDERADAGRVAEHRDRHLLLVQRPVVMQLAQLDVLHRERRLDLEAEDLLVEHVLDADADPQRLVGVGGPDAAPGRPDLEPAELQLGVGVDDPVPRHDQVRVPADT
jgi:hypothetical protein